MLLFQWDPKHDYMSCEAFAEWKNKNNPEFQRRGLAAYLEDVGIGNKNCIYSSQKMFEHSHT